jgi:hypothetical protein
LTLVTKVVTSVDEDVDVDELLDPPPPPQAKMPTTVADTKPRRATRFLVISIPIANLY